MKIKSLVSSLGVVVVLITLIFLFSQGSDVQAQEGKEKAPRVAPTVTKKLNADFVDNFHASASPKKNRLLALDANSKFPDSVIPDSIQRRVSGTCTAGSSIRTINANGTVTCEADDSGGGSGGWALTGNAGTNPATNSVGTTDNQPLVFKTNNGERMRISAGGNVGIGTTTPAHHLSIVGGPFWTLNNWLGAVELSNASAIGWQANNGGKLFGLGQTNGGLYFFRTTSNPGTASSPADYDMMISDNGKVGIGTLAPKANLMVKGKDISSSAIRVFQVETSTGVFAFGVDNSGYVNVGPLLGPTTTHACFQGGNFFASCASAAEYVPSIDSGNGFPQTADLVSIAPNVKNPYGDTHGPFTVEKSETPCDPNLLGFIVNPESGADGKKLNDHYLPLAIYGYFPAKVSMENGFIKRGDPLTSSSKAGYAMKATGACKIIGFALEDATKEGQIQVFADAGESSAAEVATLRGKVDTLTQENNALKQQLHVFEERLNALENDANVKQGEDAKGQDTVANIP